MTSRFGIDPASLQRGAAPPPPTSPICRPCSEPDHARCPTVLSRYVGAFQSDYDCPCYHADVEGHENAADERQAEHESEFNRRDWGADTRSLSYGASQRREYERWAEEL